MVEGFSVQFVRDILDHHEASQILDPFVGAGTTLVEARHNSIDSVGVDINPFLCFASRVKTQAYNIDKIIKECSHVLEKTREKDDLALKTPPILKFEAYYFPEIAQELLALKDSIRKIKTVKVRELFSLIFSRISVLVANVKRSPAPRFHRNKNNHSLLEIFEHLVEEVCRDIQLTSQERARVDVIRGDSRDLSFLKDQSFDLVLTSPPYCNNLDYVRHTQLELFWLGYAKDSDYLGKLRKSHLTSCEAMAHSSKGPKRVIPPVRHISRAIERKTNRRWPKMVEQYFEGMGKNLKEVGRVLRPNGKAIYVVGDSWIQGVHIPTPQILAKIAKSEGYKVSLEFLRERKGPRRHSNFLGEYKLEMTNIS